MQKRMRVGLAAFIVLALAVFTSLNSALPGSCQLYLNTDPQMCGILLGQDSGGEHNGAVEICGDCFPCGALDGVCPEYFNDTSQGGNGVLGDCSGCTDPDCVGSFVGIVVDEDGNRVPGALVKAVPPNPSIAALPFTTNNNGEFYWMQAISTGYWDIVISMQGFDTLVERVLVTSLPGEPRYFTLLDATCHSDCTNAYNRCAACEGVRGCHYQPLAETLCMDKVKGTHIPVQVAGDSVTSLVCCTGEETVEEFRPVTTVSGDMENLVTYSVSARLDGRPVRIRFAVWE